VKWDKKSLHNKLNNLRLHFLKWCGLCGKSGLGRDKATGSVTADSSYWNDNPEVHFFFSFPSINYYCIDVCNELVSCFPFPLSSTIALMYAMNQFPAFHFPLSITVMNQFPAFLSLYQVLLH
jgi:hypothetical protein